MKAKRSAKPVHKCHACGLNLGDRCAVYPVPRDKWRRKDCPGFGNEKMLWEYQQEQAKLQADTSRGKRRAKAKERSSEPHWQGTLPLANR